MTFLQLLLALLGLPKLVESEARWVKFDSIFEKPMITEIINKNQNINNCLCLQTDGRERQRFETSKCDQYK